jgi:glucokinase
MLLGFDIGGTKCAAILGEKTGHEGLRIIDKTVLPTDKPVFEMIESLFISAEALLEKYGVAKDDIESTGISCGGPLDSKAGIILSPPNLPGWDRIPIVDLARQRFGKMALLQNDANACAIAEWKYGAGKGYQNIVFLTFGTGMGAGLILNGQLYSGTSDAAGEVGHIRLSDNGPVGFGKSGSFEGFCSGGGIAQLAQTKAKEKLQMGEKTSYCLSMDELPSITAKSVAAAAYAGDKDAIDVYKTSARYLGKGLSLLMDILNPEVIIIGGIYPRALSLIEPSMNEVIAQEVLPGVYRSCRIVPALLGENTGDMAALALADFVK